MSQVIPSQGSTVMARVFNDDEPCTVMDVVGDNVQLKPHSRLSSILRPIMQVFPAKRIRLDLLVDGKWVPASHDKRLAMFGPDHADRDIKASVYAKNRASAKLAFKIPDGFDGRWKLVDCT